MPFVVIEVPPDAAESAEWMGTKQKFWFHHETLGRCLFKVARPGTGEDWSERIACELADLLDIPHAHYELASWDGVRGTVSPSLLSPRETLVHGNELLAAGVRGDRSPIVEPHFGNSRHTLDAVFAALESSLAALPPGCGVPAQVGSARDLFIGYLMLDALIGNTDRHHENWALIEADTGLGTPPIRYLSPTYDHASSLGRNEPEANILRRLATRDVGYSVSGYAARASSALYLSVGDRKPLSTLDAFAAAGLVAPAAFASWIERLERVPVEELTAVVAEVPSNRLSPNTARFVGEIIRFNYARISDLR
jgi:hypothetical protein